MVFHVSAPSAAPLPRPLLPCQSSVAPHEACIVPIIITSAHQLDAVGARHAPRSDSGTIPPARNLPMFNPSKDEVRRFFIDAWRRRANSVLTQLEILAVQWMEQHPEYHDDLTAPDALEREYGVEQGSSNPFLHLSMHLSITEQVSIDQPPGIKQACRLLASRLGEHEAQHAIMECLGAMLWTAQRSGLPPDGEAYVECVRRRATRD